MKLLVVWSSLAIGLALASIPPQDRSKSAFRQGNSLHNSKEFDRRLDFLPPEATYQHVSTHESLDDYTQSRLQARWLQKREMSSIGMQKMRRRGIPLRNYRRAEPKNKPAQGSSSNGTSRPLSRASSAPNLQDTKLSAGTPKKQTAPSQETPKGSPVNSRPNSPSAHRQDHLHVVPNLPKVNIKPRPRLAPAPEGGSPLSTFYGTPFSSIAGSPRSSSRSSSPLDSPRSDADFSTPKNTRPFSTGFQRDHSATSSLHSAKSFLSGETLGASASSYSTNPTSTNSNVGSSSQMFRPQPYPPPPRAKSASKLPVSTNAGRNPSVPEIFQTQTSAPPSRPLPTPPDKPSTSFNRVAASLGRPILWVQNNPAKAVRVGSSMAGNLASGGAAIAASYHNVPGAATLAIASACIKFGIDCYDGRDKVKTWHKQKGISPQEDAAVVHKVVTAAKEAPVNLASKIVKTLKKPLASSGSSSLEGSPPESRRGSAKMPAEERPWPIDNLPVRKRGV